MERWGKKEWCGGSSRGMRGEAEEEGVAMVVVKEKWSERGRRVEQFSRVVPAYFILVPIVWV